MDLASFLSAGFLVTRRVPRDPLDSPDLLPEELISASMCIAPRAPESWAIAWCHHELEERGAEAWRFGVPPGAVAGVVAAITALVADSSRYYCLGSLCATLEDASAVAGVLGERQGILILELGLHAQHAELFTSAARPPPSPPGYAPVAEPGELEALRRRLPVSAAGRLLGFEPLVFDHSLSCSWLCNGLERDAATLLGIRPNPAGLLGDFRQAMSVIAYIDEHCPGAEPGLWLPWMILEHEAEAPARCG
jgi:hypothetical protein